MRTRQLIIDADDSGHFVLTVLDGTMSVGTSPDNAEVVLPGLHVRRIRCEIEVEENLVVAQAPQAPPGSAAAQLRPGESVHVGHASIRFVGDPEPAADGDSAVHTALTPTAHDGTLARRLVVIDGADLGRSFSVPSAGSVLIGNSQKHAGIVLHDLYVARAHCELRMDDGHLIATHQEGSRGTLVNGQKITSQELRLGDILRVGNSHLRYELGVADAPPAEAADGAATVGLQLPGAASGRMPMPDAPRSDPLLKLENQPFGNYQLGPVLGQGHSGVCFRATHRQTNQVVTLKVLAADFPLSDTETQNLVKALKVAAPLRHPHLITLHAAGKTGMNWWLAREHIDGESLASVIERQNTEGKLSWKRACRVAIHLGQVLEYLEQHRAWPGNLTPSSVLIETGTRSTKLAGVMLDRALEGSRFEKGSAEKSWAARLPYRAPEQGGSTAAGPHAALYSLGAVLYALLTGQPPYVGTSPEAIRALAREGKLVKPSKVVRDLPAPLEAAVLKLLARDPEDRYQTAAALLADVEPIAFMHEIKV